MDRCIARLCEADVDVQDALKQGKLPIVGRIVECCHARNPRREATCTCDTARDADRAHGCVGCAVCLSFGVLHPTESIVVNLELCQQAREFEKRNIPSRLRSILGD